MEEKGTETPPRQSKHTQHSHWSNSPRASIGVKTHGVGVGRHDQDLHVVVVEKTNKDHGSW